MQKLSGDSSQNAVLRWPFPQTGSCDTGMSPPLLKSSSPSSPFPPLNLSWRR
ncbi:hypothetical protein KC19_VG165800 [Ceratodon purpureus]|uniref:Uncharacterized protein n=1 Tax=Ceratodon purpureus TaxID=3225 RepID=A0A8T0HQS2_CERPU|nr:hypothetical protein KC19_VG165800 [Ceratodon purpureus]